MSSTPCACALQAYQQPLGAAALPGDAFGMGAASLSQGGVTMDQLQASFANLSAAGGGARITLPTSVSPTAGEVGQAGEGSQ